MTFGWCDVVNLLKTTTNQLVKGVKLQTDKICLRYSRKLLATV